LWKNVDKWLYLVFETKVIEMAEFRGRRFLGATVSAIIERFHDGQWEILLQTRWKPEEDMKHSGLLEIPGGRIEVGEDVIPALKREVKEECGLEIESIRPGKETLTTGKFGEVSTAFVPFCGERFYLSSNDGQYSGSNFVGFVCVCTAKGELITKGIYDAKEPRWVPFSELKRLVLNEPEKIYSYHLSTLKYYLEQKEKGNI
jgi:8-oxo-dGTP pyrophosphatase MutT (NUDIX family)